MAALYLDFWFDFASTYSYPAIMRVGALAHREAVAIHFRPFLLGPIFKTQGWSTSPFNLFAAKGRNMWRDLERTCAGLGLAFHRPEPFPQSSVLAARIALVGLGERWRNDFCRAVFNAEFAEGRRIDEPETMRGILAGASDRADRRDQRSAARGDREGARARYFRRPKLSHCGRRTFLGKRPA